VNVRIYRVARVRVVRDVVVSRSGCRSTAGSARRTAQERGYCFGGSDRAYPVPLSTQAARWSSVRRSSEPTCSQPGIARPRISVTLAADAATRAADRCCGGSSYVQRDWASHRPTLSSRRDALTPMPGDPFTRLATRRLECIKAWKPEIRAQYPLKADSYVFNKAKKRCAESGDATRSSPAAGRKS
jgi:hypothetical protein